MLTARLNKVEHCEDADFGTNHTDKAPDLARCHTPQHDLSPALTGSSAARAGAALTRILVAKAAAQLRPRGCISTPQAREQDLGPRQWVLLAAQARLVMVECDPHKPGQSTAPASQHHSNQLSSLQPSPAPQHPFDCHDASCGRPAQAVGLPFHSLLPSESPGLDCGHAPVTSRAWSGSCSWGQCSAGWASLRHSQASSLYQLSARSGRQSSVIICPTACTTSALLSV